MGFKVGLLCGAREGIIVRITLGRGVGCLLGCTVGRVVGSGVGCCDGAAVGVIVGEGVSRKEGLTVGLYVLVGPLVLGWLVGCGETEGAEVGLLLG